MQGYSHAYSPYQGATIQDQRFLVTGRVILSAESHTEPRRLFFLDGISGQLHSDGVRLNAELQGDVELTVSQEQQESGVPFAELSVKRLTGVDLHGKSQHAQAGEMTVVAQAMGLEKEFVIPVRVTRRGLNTFVVEPYKGAQVPAQLMFGSGSISQLLNLETAPQHTSYFFKLVLTRQGS